MISVLLQEGATQNYRSKTGCSALMKAIGCRNPEAVKLLLENKASVHDMNDAGMTPLMLAESIRDKEMIELLQSYAS